MGVVNCGGMVGCIDRVAGPYGEEGVCLSVDRQSQGQVVHKNQGLGQGHGQGQFHDTTGQKGRRFVGDANAGPLQVGTTAMSSANAYPNFVSL